MAKRKNHAQKTETTGAAVGFEAQLWQMADACAAPWMPPSTSTSSSVSSF